MAKPIKIRVIQEIEISITDNATSINSKVTAIDDNKESVELNDSPKIIDASYIKDYLTATRSPLKEYVLSLIEEHKNEKISNQKDCQ
jgi:hypothetical protein